MAIYNGNKVVEQTFRTKLDNIDNIYPIGTIYTTLDSAFNPNTTWGGTWELIEGARIVTDWSKDVYVYGNGKVLGLNDGKNNLGMQAESGYGVTTRTGFYDQVIGYPYSSSMGNPELKQGMGVLDKNEERLPNAQPSGLVGELAINEPIQVYMWKRTA